MTTVQTPLRWMSLTLLLGLLLMTGCRSTPTASTDRNTLRIVVSIPPQFSQRDAETMAKEIGGEVLLIDPLAYDWLANLQRVAETFAEVLQPPTALVAIK